MVLTFVSQNHLSGLLKQRFLGSPVEFLISESWVGPKNCISSKFPSGAETTGTGTRIGAKEGNLRKTHKVGFHLYKVQGKAN